MYELDDPRNGPQNLPSEFAGTQQTHVKSEHFTKVKKLAYDKDRVCLGGRGDHTFSFLVHSHQTLNLDLQH